MNWLTLWEGISATEEDPLKQVGRVSREKKIDEAVLQFIVTDIRNKLRLTETDSVLDLCCGNGLLTSMIAPYCNKIKGIDFSETLIKTAKTRFSLPNTDYAVGDAYDLSGLRPEKYDKILLYFSFQYFDTFEKGKKVIREMLSVFAPGGMILLGDVPDYALYGNHYRTIPQKIRFHYENFTGKNRIGKFWKEKEMELIAADFNLTAERLTQPESLPYSHYRRDYLLKRIKD